MTENQIAAFIVNSSLQVHKTLGPGLLESVYLECLMYELISEGLHVQKQVAQPVHYDDILIPQGFRIDLLVENKVVIEIKSVEALNDVHFAQILTYLKLGSFKLGLLINFNVQLIKDGLKRVVNGL